MFDFLVERKLNPYLIEHLCYVFMWFLVYNAFSVILRYLVPRHFILWMPQVMNWPFVFLCVWVLTCAGGLLCDSVMIRYLYDKKRNTTKIIQNIKIDYFTEDSAYLNGEILLPLFVSYPMFRMALKYKEGRSAKTVRFVAGVEKVSLIGLWDSFDENLQTYPYDFEVYEHSRVLKHVLLRDDYRYPEEIREIVDVFNKVYP